MSSSVEVLIPYQGNEPHRARALDMVLDFYEEMLPEWPVRVGVDHGETFSRARALNQMVAEASADVVVFNDADSLMPAHQLLQAARLAASADGLVFAYTRYRRMTEEATADLHSWVDALAAWRDDCFEWQMLNAGSNGGLAVARSFVHRVGGFDEAFEGWGYEDLAFDVVCESFRENRRVGGDLVHLWHRPAEDVHPAQSAANRARYEREYVPRWGDRDGLRALRGLA